MKRRLRCFHWFKDWQLVISSRIGGGLDKVNTIEILDGNEDHVMNEELGLEGSDCQLGCDFVSDDEDSVADVCLKIDERAVRSCRVVNERHAQIRGRLRVIGMEGNGTVHEARWW